MGKPSRRRCLVQSPTVKGTFSFRNPLKHIFGFREDYDKIVYGLKHRLTLVTKIDEDVIFRAAGAGSGKVSLHKMSWFLLHVNPADGDKCSTYKTIESNVKLPSVLPVNMAAVALDFRYSFRFYSILNASLCISTCHHLQQYRVTRVTI